MTYYHKRRDIRALLLSLLNEYGDCEILLQESVGSESQDYGHMPLSEAIDAWEGGEPLIGVQIYH